LRFLKGNAVLLEIGLCLRRTPIEADHTYIVCMPVRMSMRPNARRRRA
jgi:hypothetical protein